MSKSGLTDPICDLCQRRVAKAYAKFETFRVFVCRQCKQQLEWREQHVLGKIDHEQFHSTASPQENK